MSELDGLMETFGEVGGDRGVFSDRHVAHVAVSGHTILSMREVEGFEVQARETATGIEAKVRVSEGVEIERPVHLCFGLLRPEGLQEIKMEVKLERNSSAHFIAHCMFPKAEKVRHVMDAVVEVGEGALYRYSEAHYHGPQGGGKARHRLLGGGGGGSRRRAAGPGLRPCHGRDKDKGEGGA
jgi:hypothetical protein